MTKGHWVATFGLMLSLLVLGIVACGGTQAQGPNPTPSAEAPSIKTVAPKAGDTLPSAEAPSIKTVAPKAGDTLPRAEAPSIKIDAPKAGDNPPRTEAPSIKMVSPKAGDTLSADAIQVTVDIRGFIIDAEAVGKAAVAGRGHFHVYVDGVWVEFSAVGRVTLKPVTSGPHHLRVSLANNDHSPLTPPVEDSIVVEVVGGAAAPPVTGEQPETGPKY